MEPWGTSLATHPRELVFGQPVLELGCFCRCRHVNPPPRSFTGSWHLPGARFPGDAHWLTAQEIQFPACWRCSCLQATPRPALPRPLPPRQQGVLPAPASAPTSGLLQLEYQPPSSGNFQLVLCPICIVWGGSQGGGVMKVLIRRSAN